MKLNQRLVNGYTVSAFVHLILLIILALLIIKPFVPSRWHSFEWELDPAKPLQEPASNKGVSGKAVEEDSTPVQETVREENKGTSPANVIPAEIAPILDVPKPIDISASTNAPVRAVRKFSSTLRNMGENLATGNLGFSASMEQGGGEAYIISQPKPQIVPTEEGEVYLEFKLTPTGKVDSSSINVLSYNSAAYLESVRKAMASWKFGFRGAYNPERLYRIRCKFVVDEQ